MIAGIANKWNPVKQLKPVLGVWNVVGVAALAAMAIRGCGTEEDIPQDPTYDPEDRCYALSGTGQLQCKYFDEGSIAYSYELSGANAATEIINVSQLDLRTWQCQYRTTDNKIASARQSTDYGTAVEFWLKPGQNSHCLGDEPDWTEPDGPIGPEQDGPTYQDDDDPELTCSWTITPVEAYLDGNNIYRTRYKVEANDIRCGAPFYYWESDRGPVIQPPGPETPPPDVVQPFEVPNLTGTRYSMFGVCEDPEQWPDQPFDQPIFTWDFETQDAFQGLARRIDALSEMIALSGLLRTPTCDPCDEKPISVGEWRTISFRSDSVSPFGKSRLRKRFRYRGQQSFGLGEVVEHWKDFTFQSGAVIVQHLGAPWGSPKIWAATADEGKRVIRHAAGEAGLNPDQVGRWQISGSSSARLGVSDTMRIDTKGGYYWITARDGSDERPLVART